MPRRWRNSKHELIRADLGSEIAGRIAAALGEAASTRAISARRGEGGRSPARSRRCLAPVAKPLEVDGAEPFVILVAGVNGSGKTTTIGKLAAKFRAEGKSGDAGGRRHLPRRRHRSAQDLGRAHRRERDGARAGRRRRGPGVRRARRRQGARRRRRAGRHRRPLAEPRRTDERTGKDGARHAQGRPGRAARGAAGARRDRRAERAQSRSRSSARSRASPDW